MSPSSPIDGASTKPRATDSLTVAASPPQVPTFKSEAAWQTYIDSGLDMGLSLTLANHVRGEFDETGRGKPTTVENGHGTELAVIAVGAPEFGLTGVAPSANLLVLKVTDASGHAAPAAVADAIRWAADHGATVVNISLATMVSNAGISSSIAEVVKRGVQVVAAAGDAGDKGPEFPAADAGVVTAYGQDHSGEVAWDSNWPIGAAVLAPGIDIATVMPGPRRLRVNGTSAAAAIVSALLADCRSERTVTGEPGAGVSRDCIRLITQPANARGFVDLRHLLKVR